LKGLIGLVAVAALLASIGCGGGTEVPDVDGLASDEATRVLEDAGFAVEEQVDPDIDLNPLDPAWGTVTDQDPDGGDSAGEGDTVEITVVSGD
jgi:beta-lactam-binding protein with PASTA domain